MCPNPVGLSAHFNRLRAITGLIRPASLRWEVGNAATAGVKRNRLTTGRARQLVTDFEQVTIRDLAVDLRRAVDLGLQLGIYA